MSLILRIVAVLWLELFVSTGATKKLQMLSRVLAVILMVCWTIEILLYRDEIFPS